MALNNLSCIFWSRLDSRKKFYILQMDSGTMVMVAANGVSIDSHYILDGCDNGVASYRTLNAAEPIRRLNAAQPIRDMDSHYIIDGSHYGDLVSPFSSFFLF